MFLVFFFKATLVCLHDIAFLPFLPFLSFLFSREDGGYSWRGITASKS